MCDCGARADEFWDLRERLAQEREARRAAEERAENAAVEIETLCRLTRGAVMLAHVHGWRTTDEEAERVRAEVRAARAAGSSEEMRP